MIAAKDNPFAVGRIQALGYIPQMMSRRQIHRRLEQLNYTAAIVGPHGSGKTTLLRELEKHIQQSGVQTKKLFINLDTRLPWRTVRESVKSVDPGGILFFDGACHLSFLRFRQLCSLTRKQKLGLVITSHQEGLLPTLICCRPHLELLAELVKRLLPEDETIETSHLEDLFELHNGNLRDCLWQLYDEYAESQQYVQHI